ncbi:transcriptional repressor LexA [Thermaerobacter subterraneus]|uniref:LexA repressor n=1 Tax=Thermaerobacter subterraneus DSM 13965 TaxID=867903 RepID=K6PM24_9FIRM|nr:transcriptional repressor LexA [Thermaerobacter subterraneus]EKP93922.1 SOS regulatory protein LexA [Thermaerobacter subterraneus DSM 13965]
MEELTRRQRQILDYIKASIRERGYPPSVREIGEAVGLKSTSTVHTYLARLERKGYIRRDPTKPRAIEVLEESGLRTRTVPVPLVGQVTAGQPILAVENIEDVLPLPTELVPEGEVFALRIRGDSMIGAGILDGDYVIVRRQETADNGDIVVALIDDEATVKRFYRERDGIRLQPENPAMEPIRVRTARILGKVVALLRRMI